MTLVPRFDGEQDATEDPSLVGQVLEGKYQIVGELGAGGMGMVYQGRNLAVGRRVAIKTMLSRHRHDAGLIERFEREAQASALVDHPNVIDVLDLGHDADGLPYIVMEHLEGGVLYDVLASQGPLAPAKAVRIVVQMLDALAAAHAAGVVHRDIKPENVFLTKRAAAEDAVKILDFGVAKFAPPWKQPRAWVTASGCAVGTPGYMAPEQALGTAVDQRSDLYSTGVVLFELLTGTLPCDVRQHAEDKPSSLLSRMLTRDPVPLRQLAPWVSPELAAVVTRAIARVPGDRFQTAREFRLALFPFTAEEGALPPLPRRSSTQEKRPCVAMPLQSALAVAEDIATRDTLRLRPARRLPSLWLVLALLATALAMGTLAARFGGGSSADAAPAQAEQPPAEAEVAGRP